MRRTFYAGQIYQDPARHNVRLPALPQMAALFLDMFARRMEGCLTSGSWTGGAEVYQPVDFCSMARVGREQVKRRSGRRSEPRRFRCRNCIARLLVTGLPENQQAVSGFSPVHAKRLNSLSIHLLALRACMDGFPFVRNCDDSALGTVIAVKGSP